VTFLQAEKELSLGIIGLFPLVRKIIINQFPRDGWF